MAARNANLETSLEVDIMILDYMLCTTIKAIMNERISERNAAPDPRDCESWLEMSEVLIHLFTTNHSAEAVPQDLQIKTHILNFANLFLRRFKSTSYLPSGQFLQSERRENTERARTWLQQNKDELLQLDWDDSLSDANSIQSSLNDNYRDMLSHMGVPVPSDDARPSLENSVALLDILPQYMKLGELIPSELKENWMNNAVVFMLHSALEQILIYGKTEPHILDEAFAWGWKSSETMRDGDEEIDWNVRRDELKASLSPKEGSEWVDELRNILVQYPLFSFEGSVLGILEELFNMLDCPVLMQLEAEGFFESRKLDMENIKNMISMP